MNRHRRRVWLVIVLAWSVLLPACATPKREAPAETWSYVTTRLPPFWWYDRVDVAGARAKGRAGTGSSVAVVDTGVLAPHEDLGNVAPGVATCGSNSADTMDRKGHGTELAGIVLGRDRGRATRGVAPAAAVIPIKIDCGVVSAGPLTQGVDRAIERKAEIILLALGGYPPGPPDVDAFLTDRVRKNPDILFVVASTWDGSAQYPFPPWTRLDNAIVVAAMTLDDQQNEVPYGAKRGDLWAPGRDVETASIEPSAGANPHDPFLMQGTSAASAIVAGCAALVKETTGHVGARLKTILIATAEVKPGLGSTNNGRLNCSKAIP